MSDNRRISAIAGERSRVWYPLGASTVFLAIGVFLLFYVLSLQISPCGQTVAHAATCSVGDDETFTGPVTFEKEINAGSTPVPGTAGQVLISNGPGVGPDWTDIFTTVVKSADETLTTDTTLQDDDDVTFIAAANSVYYIDALLFVNSPTAADFKFAWTVPAGATADGHVLGHDAAADEEIKTFVEAASQFMPTLSVTDDIITMKLIVQTAGTSGAVTLQWAQNASSGTTTVKIGTLARIQKVG